MENNIFNTGNLYSEETTIENNENTQINNENNLYLDNYLSNFGEIEINENDFINSGENIGKIEEKIETNNNSLLKIFKSFFSIYIILTILTSLFFLGVSGDGVSYNLYSLKNGILNYFFENEESFDYKSYEMNIDDDMITMPEIDNLEITDGRDFMNLETE